MKPFLILVAACFLISAPVVQAQTAPPEDEYFNVYTLIQKGENLQARGKDAQAHTNYVNAETALKKLQEDYPLWEPQVVKYRLNYLQSKVAGTVPAAAKPGMTGGSQKPVAEIITPGDPSEPVTMKVKWQVGKRYLMTVQQGVNAEVTPPGQAKPMKQALDSTLNLAVDVLKERDGGGEELELQDLGSKTAGSAATASPLAGLHIKYLTDANGKIESVEDIEEVRNRLAASVPAEMQDAMKKTITEKSLKDMVSMDDRLPDKPVKSGDTWSKKTDLGLPGSPDSQKLSVEVKYTLVGWTTREQQKCAVIEFAGDKASPSGAGQATEAPVSVQSVNEKGKIWFNPDLGMVAEMGAKVAFTLQPNGGHLDETTGTKVVVTDIAR